MSRGLRLWEDPEVWPHRAAAISILGLQIQVTVALDTDERRVALGIWLEGQPVCRCWLTSQAASIIGRALLTEAAETTTGTAA